MTARACRHAPLALLALVLIAAPVAGQVPGFLKKKLKQVEKADSCTPPTFDDVTLELMPERLDALLAGIKAGEVIAKGPNGPAALQAKREKLQEERNKLSAANDKAYYAWDEKRRDIDRCRGDAFSERGDARNTQSQASPEMMKLAMAMAQAQAKGDTAEVRRLLAKLQGLKEPTAADTAEVDRKCGKVPDPPPAVGRMRSLDEQIDSTDKQIRRAEEEVSKAEQGESKMTEKQIRMAIERILAWLAATERQAALQGYSCVERKALQDRAKELKERVRLR